MFFFFFFFFFFFQAEDGIRDFCLSRGLGSAHEGAHHWLLQRFTAIGNLVLMLFLAVSLALLPDYSYGTVAGWASQTVPATALALLIVSVFWHARLGLQVLIEDYVQDHGLKFGLIILLNFFALGGASLGICSVAKIAFTGVVA